MRRWFPLVVLCFATPASAGLFGSDAPGRIPVPARIFTVEIEDTGGTSVRIERATFDGEVFVYGMVGLAQVTVPFERITALVIELGPDDDHRTAVIADPNGDIVRVVVEADRPVFGLAAFGNYKIETKDMRRFAVLAEKER